MEVHSISLVAGTYVVSVRHSDIKVVVLEHLLCKVAAKHNNARITVENAVDEGGTTYNSSALGGEGVRASLCITVVEKRMKLVNQVCIGVLCGKVTLINKVFTAVKSAEVRISDNLCKGRSITVHRHALGVLCNSVCHDIKRDVLSGEVGEHHHLVVDLIQIYHELVICGKHRGLGIDYAAVALCATSTAKRGSTRGEGERSVKNYSRCSVLLGTSGVLSGYGLSVTEYTLNVDGVRDNAGNLHVYGRAVKIESAVGVGLGSAKTHKCGCGKLTYHARSINDFCHCFLLVQIILKYCVR